MWEVGKGGGGARAALRMPPKRTVRRQHVAVPSCMGADEEDDRGDMKAEARQRRGKQGAHTSAKRSSVTALAPEEQAVQC